MIATVPGLGPMRITHEQAESLGQAWAGYLDSIPSRKKKAAMESIERIVPGIIALGTTAMVFGPRVKFIMDVRAGRVQLETRRGHGPTPTARMPAAGERVGPAAEQVDEAGWELQTPNPPGDGKVIPDRRAQLDAENDMGASP